eukprot:ANDGO_06065.mRNA.1 hypothetical protein
MTQTQSHRKQSPLTLLSMQRMKDYLERSFPALSFEHFSRSFLNPLVENIVDDFEMEIANLKSVNAQYDVQRLRNTETRDLERENATLRQEISVLKERNAELTERWMHTAGDRDIASTGITFRTQELDVVRSENGKMHHELDRCKKEMERLRKDLVIASSSRDACSSQIQQVLQENDLLRQENSAMAHDRGYASKYALLERETTMLRMQNDDLLRELNDHRRVVAELESQVSKGQRTFTELSVAHAELSTLRMENDELSSALSQFRTLEAEHKAALARCAALETTVVENEVLRERMNVASEDIDQLRSQIRSLEADVSASSVDFVEARTSFDALQKQHVALQQESKRLREDLERSARQVDSLKMQLESVEAEKQQVQQTVAASNAEIDQLEAQIHHLRGELSRTHLDSSDAQRVRDELVRDLETALDRAQDEVAHMERQILTLKNQIDELSPANVALRHQISRMESDFNDQLQHRDSRIDSLEAERTRLRELCTDYEHRLQNFAKEQEGVSAMGQEIVRMREELAMAEDMEIVIGQIRETLEVVRAKNAMLERRCADIMHEKDQLQLILDNRDADGSHLREELRAVQHQLAKTEEDCAWKMRELRVAKENMEKRLQEKVSANDKLSAEIRDLRVRFNDEKDLVSRAQHETKNIDAQRDRAEKELKQLKDRYKRLELERDSLARDLQNEKERSAHVRSTPSKTPAKSTPSRSASRNSEV